MVFLLIVSITIYQIHGLGSGPCPFVKAPQPGDSEATPAVPEPSRHPPPPVQPHTGRGNTTKRPAQGHNKQTRRPTSTPTPQNAERQAGKPQTPNLQSPLVWLDHSYTQPVHTTKTKAAPPEGRPPFIHPEQFKVLKKLQLAGKKPAPQKSHSRPDHVNLIVDEYLL